MTKNKTKRRTNKFLRSSFFPFVIIASLMLMQMFALFTVSEWQKVDTYDNQVNRELDNCITDIDNMFENLKQVVINTKLDGEIIAALSKPDITPIEQQRVFMKLSSYRKFIKDIKNICVFNSTSNVVYSTVKTAKPLEEFPFGKTRELLMNGWEGKQPMVILDKADYAEELYGSEKVFRLMMKYDSFSRDVIMADVGFDAVRDVFRPFEKNMGGKVYIRSSSGEILYGDSGQEEPPVELLDVELEEKKAIRSYYGKKYLVTHKRIKQMDMDVFSVIPEDKMNVGNFETRTLLIINLVIISIIVLLGALFSLFRSLRKTAKRNAKELENMKQNDIRENFLKKHKPVIDCFKLPTPEELELCKGYLNSVSSDKPVTKVALARVDFCGMNGEELMLREKYSLIKRTEEIFRHSIFAYAVYEQGDYVLLLLTDPGFDHVGRCRKAYQECCEAFAEMNIVPACYVSSAADVDGLHEIYVEIANLAEYMFIYSRPMFLDYTLVFQRVGEADKWVENGISGIRNNIMTPNEDLAAQMDNFINGLRELSVKDAKQAIYALYLAIGQCADQIRQEDMSFKFDLLEYFPRLSSLQSLDEARDLFAELAEQLQGQYTESDGNKYTMIVKRTLEIIEERLGDPTLCRSMIADEIGISKPYLGRIFKEIVGISMSDAINDMRLKAVEEQLISTNKSIKDLISDVGIVNQSYFTVMFKKKYGMSPTEYRNKKGNLS